MQILLWGALCNFRNGIKRVVEIHCTATCRGSKCQNKQGWKIQAHYMVVLSTFPMRHESSQNTTKRETAPLRLNSQESINCNMGFAQMTRGEHSLPEFTDTKFGKSPVGSF